ncbi:Lhr family ATP dependent helicase [Antricoccus suffuscus]|uniref:Lhr family ATP dependent helicase n=1 Tax=Antricoccus suffuscus TaxID=1629062 RepID=A0A2T1A5J5_9ACTN|nr:ATP-dependent helicase [Antricoccus suffuscus]PRZ43618.1 Lhr family ATP dependent helicase [Antricoccus suffuscus]
MNAEPTGANADTARADSEYAARVLGRFAEPTREWFGAAFDAPTPAQLGAWDAIATDAHALVVAPTGSGKTLAAFLSALDTISRTPIPENRQHRCSVLYISPLKALAVDVERNLRAPLSGIHNAARRLGLPDRQINVSSRTSDTSPAQRRTFARTPGDILVTTPESLFLLLTSAAREALRGVQTVIIDEIHAMAGTKRGSHLALSLERLDELLERPAQRIGLSATVRPIDKVAGFLSGTGTARETIVVAPASEKQVDLDVVVPVEDLSDLTDQRGPDGELARSIWPAVDERIYQLVRDHRSTIVFTNSRRTAERLTSRLNELADEHAQTDSQSTETGAVRSRTQAEMRMPAEMMAQAGVGRPAVEGAVIARAHHGSVSREQRTITEEGLKQGTLPAVVATSSLELGIDMGAVDLVVQVESPPSVAAGLQRVGRAGHHVGAASKGVFFPKHRGDLVTTTVVASHMARGDIEALQIPQNPLDVLAQHIIAMLAMRPYDVAELTALIHRAAPYAHLPESALHGVLDMLSGRYPSDDFAQLRPRIVWDRHTDTLTARPGAQRLAVISGGTIPDRGLFGVFIAGGDDERGGRRVGELDEEMVYESRVGDIFLLGSSSWRITEITHDRVLVVPAPGMPGKMPFWTGEQQGRPLELGRSIGEFVRTYSGLDSESGDTLARESGLDDYGVRNLRDYLDQQRDATGVLPTDRQIVFERFRDELGDWRVVVHSPFGDQVNAPWSLIIRARLAERYGVDAQAVHADDGIVLRIPDTADEPPTAELLAIDPDEVTDLVTAQISTSALFASRFRECASRALLLPRRDPGKRSPLWQQRQRAAQLLTVASRYPDFPIILETVRECLQDVYDVPGLVEIMTSIRSRSIRVTEVETPRASPFAQSLLFGYLAAFIYQEDLPMAERRAGALSLDIGLLRELLGHAELRELLDADAMHEVELRLQRLDPERPLRDAEDLADALRLLGDLSDEQIARRGGEPSWAKSLRDARRAVGVRVAGEDRWIAIEDAGRYRDALGVALPVGVPEAFTVPLDDPLGELVGRYARTHGPFGFAEVASRFGLGTAIARVALDRLTAEGRLSAGEFRPGGTGSEWCDVEVLRLIRRRSLAAIRAEVEPVTTSRFATFLQSWHGIGDVHRGSDGLYAVIEQLAGAPLVASALETLILPSRVRDYSPAMLDELTSQGEVGWCGAGGLPGGDGLIRLTTAELAPILPLPSHDSSPLADAVLAALPGGQAMFFRPLSDYVGRTLGTLIEDRVLIEQLWQLVWDGLLTNDTIAPLRYLLSAGGTTRADRPARGSRSRGRPGRMGRARMPSVSGPPTVTGRWSRVQREELEPTARAQLLADVLLDRYGVLTRGSVQAEGIAGGFGGLYPLLAEYEDSGRARRGYFIDRLGAAQFATPGAVDRLRAESPSRQPAACVVLAATDPAQPYGAALSWPERVDADRTRAGHRPGRKAGAVVAIVGGDAVIYVERGGKTLLSFTRDEEALARAASAIADAVRSGALGKLVVERTDGASVHGGGPLATALESAGFRLTPRGLRLRG